MATRDELLAAVSERLRALQSSEERDKKSKEIKSIHMHAAVRIEQQRRGSGGSSGGSSGAARPAGAVPLGAAGARTYGGTAGAVHASSGSKSGASIGPYVKLKMESKQL